MRLPSITESLRGVEHWRERAKDTLSSNFSEPVAHILATAGITPNKVTVAGAVLSVGAGCVIANGHPVTGGLLVLASGVMDVLDGALARVTGRQTRFGAVMDSTLDRVSEAAVLCGLAIMYTGIHSTSLVLLVYATLVGSVLVSYVRARAEGLGVDCKVGIFTRSERMIIMVAGLLLNLVPPALVILSLFSYVTVAQRLAHIRRATADDS